MKRSSYCVVGDCSGRVESLGWEKRVFGGNVGEGEDKADG